MKIITLHVRPNEKVEMYFTGPKSRPQFSDDENPRMIEQIFVVRDDTIACYEQDFGPADDYPYVPPLLMPSFGEMDVAEVQWHGERHRNDDKWAKRMQEYKEGSTLFNDIIEQEAQRLEARRNRSVLGPFVNTQRNEFSRETAERRWNDERRRRTGKVQL